MPGNPFQANAIVPVHSEICFDFCASFRSLVNGSKEGKGGTDASLPIETQ